jgi:hypothetical protein
VVIRSKRLLFIAIPVVAIPTFLLVFFLGPNNDDIASDKQELSDTQPKGQNKIDDYSLRGAVSNNSGGKQVLEKYQTYLCGGSFEKRTDFIQEYTLPFPCSQPVGITIQQQENNNSNSSNNNTTANPQKIWIAATWVGYLVVFDPESQRFSDFIEIPNWKTKGIFGSMVWDMEFDKKR